MRVLFNGLDYDKVDHNFTQEGCMSDAEMVCIIYGNTAVSGRSVAIAVRGFQPSLRLRLPDDATTLADARKRLKTFVGQIFNVNDKKRAIQGHVLCNAVSVDNKTSIYTYQHGRQDRYLTVRFQTFAAYSYFRQVVSALEQMQLHSDKTPSVLKAEITRLVTVCAENKRQKTLNKDAVAELMKQKEKWEALQKDQLLIARIEKEHDGPLRVPGQMFDAAPDVILSFLKAIGSVSQWFEVDKQSFQYPENVLTLGARLNGTIMLKDLVTRNDMTTIAPFMQAAFDIETYSAHWVQTPQGRRREFPVPQKIENTCFQIGIIFQRFGQHKMEKHIITMGDPTMLTGEDSNDVIVHRVHDERMLLVVFFKLVEAKDVDVFISYNGDGFDMNYIYHRAVMYHLLIEKQKWNAEELLEDGQYPRAVCSGPCASALSRLPQRLVQLKHDTFAQGGATTHFKRFVIPGRIHIDLHTYMQRNVKLQSYKLAAVAQEFLKNENKDDMPIERLFQAFENKSREELARVGDYCLQDCALLYSLLHAKKLKVIESLVAIARVVYCPLLYLLQRGQQIKVFAQIDRIAERLGFAIPNLIIDEIFGDSNKYQGATVLEPTSGFYYPQHMQANDDVASWSAENSIATLDFASLYPTIMMAYNICYSTILYKKTDVEQLRMMDKDIKIDEHNWDDQLKTHTRSHYLAVVQNTPAVVPTLLRELYQERKKTKKLMEAEEDPMQKLLLDRLQYAHKLSLNSVYGFCASQMMSCTILASLVTCLGRRSLQAAIDGVKLHYDGATVIYGDTDSCFVNFSTVKQHAPQTLAECAVLSEQAANLITTKYFRPPMCLEFEKIYYCFKLIGRKRYIGLKLEVDARASKAEDRVVFKKPELDAKGVILQRRDSIPLSRDTFSHICNLHAYKGLPGIQESVHYLQEVIQRMQQGDRQELPYDMFSITKKIQDRYENPFAQPQCVVAEKLRSRGKEVRSNDQIRYVVLETDDSTAFPPQLRAACEKQKKTTELPISFRAEDVDYAAEHCLPLDHVYYLSNLKTTLDLIFNIDGIPMDVQEAVSAIWRQVGLLKHYPHVFVIDVKAGTCVKKEYKTTLPTLESAAKGGGGIMAFGFDRKATSALTWDDVVIEDDTLLNMVLDVIMQFLTTHYDILCHRIKAKTMLPTVYVDKKTWKQNRHGRSVIVAYMLDKWEQCPAHGRKHTSSSAVQFVISTKGIQLLCPVQNGLWPVRPFPLHTESPLTRCLPK